jgi:hypothetical protein
MILGRGGGAPSMILGRGGGAPSMILGRGGRPVHFTFAVAECSFFFLNGGRLPLHFLEVKGVPLSTHAIILHFA